MKPSDISENKEYLTEQLLTYIGNKRALLDFIGKGVSFVQEKLGDKKLVTFDVFSGSGIVSRFLKKYSSFIYANDIENYAQIISSCYLSNKDEIDLTLLESLYNELISTTDKKIKMYVDDGNFLQCTSVDKNKSAQQSSNHPGFISELYAPKDIAHITKDDRCFYTPYNAAYIDIISKAIREVVPQSLQKFFIAPLLSECSVHANTGGVFKGFYKNRNTGVGKFGGTAANALTRIKGNISLPFPVFSNFNCPSKILCSDANTLVESKDSPAVDLAYLDPPYNQHPYGSNYFMLNLIADYKRPSEDLLSKVSGIPCNWNRSSYNKHQVAAKSFSSLVENINAKYLLVSFNNEGFISKEEMVALLTKVGKVTVLESNYNTFRASRNLSDRNIHVKEYLYVVEK